MTEQLLDDPQIRTALEQVRRKRMAQGMWTDSIGETRLGSGAFDRRPRLLPGETPTAVAQEERAAPRGSDMAPRQHADPGSVHPAREPVHRDVADRDEALLVPFADDPDE